MKHFFVRPARPTDADKFLKYSLETPGNLFDPGVPQYQNTFIRCVFDSAGPVLFAPIQRPLVIDALAFRSESEPGLPALSDIDRAVAMKELVQDVISQAYIQGSGEVMFVCKDKDTAEFAKRQLFEELPYRLFRIRLKDLESKHDKIPNI